MIRRLRPRSLYDVLAILAFFGVLAGGTAYAANTIGSSDVIDESLQSQDIKNGEVHSLDIGNNHVQSADVKNETLTGDDIAANSLEGADIDESTLTIGPGSGDFVHGRGTLLSNRIVFLPPDVPGAPFTRRLFVIPGLGVLTAACSQSPAFIYWTNTTSSTIDRWVEQNGSWSAELVPPGEGATIASTATAGGLGSGGTLALGVGNDPGARRIVTLDAFAMQSADGQPCGFQAQGTLWTSG